MSAVIDLKRGDGMKIVYVILLIVLGAAMVFKPELLWKIEHFLTTRGGEPSELYLALMRLGGTLFALCGIGMIIYSLIK